MSALEGFSLNNTGFKTCITITLTIQKPPSWNVLKIKFQYFITEFIELLDCYCGGQKSEKSFRFQWDMKINKHSIINIQVWQGKFDLINKCCHAEVKRTYPTCAFIKFIFRVIFFKPFMTSFGVNWKLKYTTHAYFMDVWVCFSFQLSHKFVSNGWKIFTPKINWIKAHVWYVWFTSARHNLMKT